MQLADRITVLRDGRYVGDLDGARRDAREDRGDDGRARAEPPLLSAPHGRARRGARARVARTCWCRGRPDAGQLHGATRRDPRLRRAGRRGAHGADADALRRHAGARRHDDARRASRSRRERRATPSTRACSSRPKTASGTGWCCRCPSPRTRRCPNVRQLQRAGACSTAQPSGGSPRREVARLRIKTPTVLHKVVGPVRRQPAEGRARQVAGDEPAGADPRRADPRHRRRRQGGNLPHMAALADAGSPSYGQLRMEEMIGMSDRVVVMHERTHQGHPAARAS